MPANSAFDDVMTSSLRYNKNSFQEQIYNHNLTFKMLDEMGFVKTKTGGYEIQENLMFDENNTVSSYSKWDTLDNTPQQTLTAATYAWKQVAGSVTIDHFTEFQNSGSSEKIVDLLDAKIMQLEISLATYFNRKWIAGDGSGNNGKDITGLLLYVEEGSAWSVVGGIDSSAVPKWRNQWIGSVGSFATNGLDKMRTMYNSTSSGIHRPKLILTTQDIYESYEKTVVNTYRSMDLKKADIGFLNLLFKETPMIFDQDCTPGYMYFLNPEYMKLLYGKGKDFQIGAFVKPINQDGKVAHVIIYCQTIVNDRQRQGLLTGITA